MCVSGVVRADLNGYGQRSVEYGFFWCPKNHGISKLVVWRSQNPAIQSQTPPKESPMILRVRKKLLPNEIMGGVTFEIGSSGEPTMLMAGQPGPLWFRYPP